MRKLFLLLGLLAALAIPGAFRAEAQTQTVVTGTVTDPNGIPYANGTMKATIQPVPPGSPCVVINGNCQPIQGTVGPISMNSSGFFSTNLWANSLIQPSGSQWSIQICISPGVAPPLGTGPQCFSVTTTISGSSQDLSAILSANAPSLASIPQGQDQSLVNVGASPYNVKGDAQVAPNATPLAPGSGSCPSGAAFGCVSTAAAAFASTDAGKEIWSSETSDGEVAQGSATILKVDSSTLVEVSAAYTRNGIGNVVWGTNYQSEINAAASASGAKNLILYFPCGNYILMSTLGVTLGGLQGATQSCVQFFPVQPWSGGNIIALGSATEQAGQSFTNFTLNGNGGISRGVSPGYGILYYQQTYIKTGNIEIQNFSSDGTAEYGAVDVHDSAFTDTPIVVTPAPQASPINCYFEGDSQLTIIGPLCSNSSGPNLEVNGSSGISIFGGLIDECGANANLGCTQLTNGSSVTFNGMILYGGNQSGNYCLQVDGTSSASLVNDQCTPFAADNGSGIDIASGGVVRLSQTYVLANDAGNVAFTNAGTLIDSGGNLFSATNGATLYSGAGAVPSEPSVNQAAQTTGNIALTSGWSSSTVTAVTGATTPETFTIALAGTPTLNPVATVTFPTPYLVAPTGCSIQETGGTSATLFNWTTGTVTATTAAFTLQGTPTTGTIIATMRCN